MPGSDVADLLISAPRVVPAGAGTGVLEPGYVAVRDGRISAVAAGPPPGRADIELTEGVLLPGFVDLQVNGYFGVEMGAADAGGWALVAGRLPETGTTAFLPTYITAPVADLAAGLRSAAAFVPAMPGGAARVLGVHVEGPFISPARRGAHNPRWIVPPSPAAVGELISAGAGVLRLVTLAPEAEGALAAIGRLAAAGVMISVGHSDATGGQVAEAAAAGARMVTHLFNGQRPLGSYEPGVTGQALTDHRLTSGLIADLHHVCREACVIAFATAPGRICLVTDASACAGMPPGRYLLGGEPIDLPPGDGVPPRRPDGGLAGSALRMDRAVANMVSVGVDLDVAVTAATRIPADLIGRPELGRLAPGAVADLAWLDDGLRTRGTWINGERVYA